jgi:beta-glucosidase
MEIYGETNSVNYLYQRSSRIYTNLAQIIKTMKPKSALVFLAIFIISNALAQGPALPFRNTELSYDQRIDNLLKLMTPEEKVSQLLYNSPAIDRLGIPQYNWWNECLHGVGRAGKATVFPQAIGLAATFDDKLIERIGDAISTEARAKYNVAIRKGNRTQYMGLSFWTPNINIFRDPRWGRGQETYGEDPYLTGQMGSAFVQGLQGTNPDYLKASACAKHFAVHSGPEKSRHRFNAEPFEKDLHETYLPAFKILIDNGVEAVMCAYNRLYDEPCCGSHFLLKKILRQDWGFNGHIVSDCWALDDIWKRHKVVETKEEAAAMAAKAGVNVNCGYIYKHLEEAIEQGLVKEEKLDEILRPLFMTRLKLGLFDPIGSLPFDTIGPEWVNCKSHKLLAYEAAVKSIVLLQNRDSILPLDKKKVKNIFVTGPTAANIQVLAGNYNGWSGEMVTFLEGIVDEVDAGTAVDYSQGCLMNTPGKYYGFWEAQMADVIIMCLGNSKLMEGEEGEAMLNSEGGDRNDIRLPESQREFISLMREKVPETPIIAVITGGSAIALQDVLELADAVLFAWYPGEQGGRAMADILFGEATPSGRLPVTFYASVDDLPPFDDYSMDNRTYKYFKGEPLFPFGYGLSYTNFDYTKAMVRKTNFQAGEPIHFELTLKNSGEYDGEEVVMIYASKAGQPLDEDGIFLPSSENYLVAFQRVSLKAHQSKTLSFEIDLMNMFQWDMENQCYYIQKGNYILQTNPYQGGGFMVQVAIE